MKEGNVEYIDADSGRTPSDNEKGTALGPKASYGDLPADPDAGRSEAEKLQIDKRLKWKLDLKLIPWLCLLYLCSFLDRTNIGNAKLDGLTTDLGIGTNAGLYNAALSIFFVSYSLFEPLTNILLKRLRPSIFLPAIMILWGIVMTTMGLCTNAGGLMAARFFLGLAEAGLFPGVNYYLSCWYKRGEFGIRAAIFFSAAAVAGSFGGLLAAAINLMAGLGGKGGWAWIFILEGLATFLIGIVSFWMVHDFPDDAKFLSPDDRARVIRRLKFDNQSSAEHEEFKMEYFWAAVKDWKTWNGAVIYMGADGALYAFSLFLPTIIADLGYTATTACTADSEFIIQQLLTVPPYAAAAIMTITVGYVADRTRQRGLCNIGTSLIGIAGFAMLLGGESPGVQYAGTFLGAVGIYPCVPNTISWASNNIEGVYKRGVALGIIIGWGNLNGVYDRRYKPGHATVLGYMILFLLGGSIVQRLLLARENKKRLAGQRDGWIVGKSEEEIDMLGDKKPDFIYTL
ncbi:hypothetical protein MMC34_007890 [Xylographa carneopallida]|nr:hypothetical protein [Xylographa carneopallida]